MIYISIEPADFEYDVMSLVQAFYPGKEIKVNKKEGTDSSENSGAVSSCEKLFLEVKLIGHGKGKTGYINLVFNDSENTIEKQMLCDYSNRRDTKNILKSSLYEILSKATKRQLPWGNLTGIRPAKIPALMLKEGKPEKEIREIMKSTYSISDDKLNLSLGIAKREFEILKNIPYEQGYSIYIGIPFCPTTCAYCSFTSYPIGVYKKLADRYLDALIYEIENVSKMMKGRILNTVYMGGGTPTTLEADQLDRLIKAIKTNFKMDDVVEFTVEAGRPDSITEEKLQTLIKNGVDRISINPQTMNQETLKLIGRYHTVEDVVDKFELARRVGFNNINMDIILGLPKEDSSMVAHTLAEIRSLLPDSLTVHSLAVKRAARINTQKENYADMDMVNSEDLMKQAYLAASEMGMEAYYLYRQKNMSGNLENVGYSRPGCEGIYNILMMGDKQDVIAMGAGATTKLMNEDGLGATRVDNVKNVEQYIDRIEEMIARKRKALVK